MSAFSAFKDGSGFTDLNYDLDSETNIAYEKNSSDEETELEEDPYSRENRSNFQSHQFKNSSNILPGQSPALQLITSSRFFPDEDNLMIRGDCIIIGLKVNEYILIEGQCDLSILRGAILVNDLHYLPAHPSNIVPIFAPLSQSLPIISSTQVTDRSKVMDSRTPELEHLFTSDYKSVIKITNRKSGLEDIGLCHPPLRNLYYNSSNNEEVSGFEDERLKHFSFRIVLNSQSLGVTTNNIWSTEINELIANASQIPDPVTVMVIGNKNSGKSTLSKLILNSFLLNDHAKVAFLDIDPGQSEFSLPLTLSLSIIEAPIFGANVAKVLDGNRKEYYYGYTTPQSCPEHYLEIVKHLCKWYNNAFKLQGIPLIINTPGWVKGFGKELLIDITGFFDPNFLVLLSSDKNETNDANLDIVSGLTFQKLQILPAVFKLSKYSPHQQRTLSKLTYFHQNSPLQFDFRNPLLKTSPLRISYHTKVSDDYQAVSLVSILNYDVGSSFNLSDLPEMIEASIFALYLVDYEFFRNSIAPVSKGIQSTTPNPMYLNSTDFLSFMRYDEKYFQFGGLCMVHSIDFKNSCLNIYMPCSVKNDIIDQLSQNGYKLILVRGDGEIPAADMVLPEHLLEQQRQLSSKRRKRKASDIESPKVLNIPYVSFQSTSKIGGVWKPRRNVMRRGQNM